MPTDADVIEAEGANDVSEFFVSTLLDRSKIVFLLLSIFKGFVALVEQGTTCVAATTLEAKQPPRAMKVDIAEVLVQRYERLAKDRNTCHWF